MEFEPLNSSDNDGEDATFIEKKKKEGTDKKRKSKGTPLFRSDKKERAVDSPVGAKHKQNVVHGVVGPADYIFDQTSPPGSESTTPVPPVANQPKQQWNSGQQQFPTSQQQFATPQKNQTPQKQFATPQQPQFSPTTPQQNFNNQQPRFQATPQQSQNFPPPSLPQQAFPQNDLFQQNYQQPNTSFNTFQAMFPTNFASQPSVAIERPHSSAARMNSQEANIAAASPTPFKQPATLQKSTLLSQAALATSNAPQISSTPPVNHQRNQSYSRAMTVPITRTEEAFHPLFENTLEVSVEGRSSNRKNSLGSREQLSSPQLSPSGRPTSTEFWDKEEEDTPPQQVAVGDDARDWARFPSASVSIGHEGNDDNLSTTSSTSRRKSEGSFAESVSSMESADDAIWRINDEQYEYYLEHFKNLNPEHGVVKGGKARDFFLKSNLPTDTLSRIWHLSDLDKDFALNVEEFCIAMHLVVAVRHGVELPPTLPPTLLPKSYQSSDNVDPFEADLGSPDETFDESESETEEQWTQPQAFDEIESVTEGVKAIQTVAQPSLGVSNAVNEVRPVSTEDAPVEPPTTPKLHRYTSTPAYLESTAAIARPRASANKNVNLMDASPWQLLPPPSTKGSAKKSLNMSGEEGLVMIDGTATPTDEDDSPVRLRTHTSSLLKEKSRSIDSLRSDISESSEFQWKRQSMRSDKRRSLTLDNKVSSETSINERSTKEDLDMPPVPPPRNKGHTRASSLDLNHLFNRGPQPTPDFVNDYTDAVEETKQVVKVKPMKPPRISKISPNDRPGHTRSASLDTESIKRPPARPTQALKSLAKSDNELTKSPDEGVSKVRFTEENIRSPMEVKMRRNEIQSRIRHLQATNLTLINLNNQLHVEWKELCEERVSYDIQLQKQRHMVEEI